MAQPILSLTASGRAASIRRDTMFGRAAIAGPLALVAGLTILSCGGAALAGDTKPASTTTLVNAIGHDRADRIEAHIDKLHADLKITPPQEPAWAGFAAVMRDNAIRMEAASDKRRQIHDSMDAVADLRSYDEIEAINAANVERLLPPFQTLYAGFSAQQKKAADSIVSRYIDRAVKHAG